MIMSRITDEKKWNDVWFRSLDPKSKLVWNYLCDNCDIAGFYEIDVECISFFTGLNSDDVEGAMKALGRGYEGASKAHSLIFLRNFIKVQKNHPLNPKNSCHKGIIRRLLEKEKEFETVRGYLAPIKPLGRGTGKGKGNILSFNNSQEGVVKGGEKKAEKEDMDFRQASAKAFVECVKIFPPTVRPNQMAYCRNAWNEAVERADGFESIVMAVNLYVDFVATTNFQFKKNFQNWLDDNEFNIDWRERKLKAASIQPQHIHQDFIDLWILKAKPTKAEIEAGENQLSKRDQLKTEDLIRFFEKDSNLNLASLIAKVERSYIQSRKSEQNAVTVCQNDEKKKITLEEIRIMSKMLGKDVMKKDHPELLERLKEADNTT